MRARLGLVAAVAALLVLPAAAQAAPPPNDDYVGATQINNPGQGLLGTGPDRAVFRDFPDTSEATDEAEIYPGYGEPNRCQVDTNLWSAYGKTIWYDVHPDVYGTLFIRASGFDSVLALVQYQSLDNPQPIGSVPCADDPQSPSLEEVAINVQPGAHYSIQIGGWAGYVTDPSQPNPTTPASGLLDFSVGFAPDRDRDGVYDTDDTCPTLPGSKAKGGCPDADNDGIVDPNDACPHESVIGHADRNHNGCSDYGLLASDSPFSWNPVFRHGRLVGISFTKLRVPVSSGEKVSVSCKPRSHCSRRRAGASRSKSVRAKLKFVKFRTKILLKLTKSGSVGRLITFTVKKRRGRASVSKSVRCIPATGGRSRRCSSSLTIR